jgi:hypothetical protein
MAWGQNGAIQGAIGGAIGGTIHDRYGVIVARAPVDAKNTRTGSVYHALANNQGAYTLAGLPPGTYQVSINWIAFRPFLRENVGVAEGQSVRLDIVLEDGDTLNTPGELVFRHSAEEPRKGPAPRTPEGKPDFSGVWLPAPDPHPEQPELRPAAAAIMKQRSVGASPTPRALCLPTGIVSTTELDLMKFVQTPKLLVILVEGGDPGFRQIFLDGRVHPPDLQPTWQGHSIGHWEDDTLVVDTVGFNDKVWLSLLAFQPQTERMHIVERLRRPNLGQLEIEYLIDDPGAYVKPWKIHRTLTLAPNEELQEYLCTENNKDPQHMGTR